MITGLEVNEIVNKYFEKSPNKYSTSLYNELRNQYGKEVIFEERIPSSYEKNNDEYTPAETRYNTTWIIRIMFRFLVHNDTDRILSHELLHILLRYRHNLPFIANDSTYEQAIILNEIDHKLINPILDKEYGFRKDKKRDVRGEKISKIIDKILSDVNEGIDRDKYIELFKKCTNELRQKMPNFIF